jgi:formate dehydrogenase iron-sulfur subunit
MKAILHDVSRCTGCMRCAEGCAEDNDLRDDPREARFDTGPLSFERFTTIDKTADGHFVRRQCMHCLEPSCATACLVGALVRTPEGPVLYDNTKCIGCRYCMIACPYHVLRYDWGKVLPFMKKCDLCYDREGAPACVAACPHEATMYGERDDLLKVAHARIEKAPGRYIQKVWGETEAGGTSILYVSDTPLDSYFPTALGEDSIPDLTLPLAHATPWMAAGVASTLIGLSWVIGRRNKIADEREAEAAAAVEAAKPVEGETAESSEGDA